MDREKIYEEIKKRGITKFVHFTRLDNVESIIKFGIVPSYFHDALNINAIKSNNNGYGYVCLSVSFPNYQMFYKKRLEDPNKNWVVVGIDPSVILDDNIFYSFDIGNSARSGAYNGTTYEDFLSMFKDFGNIKRESLKIPDKFTTNPQAEIMIRSEIPPKYIKSIFVCNNEDMIYLKKFISNNINLVKDPKIFSSRKDYKVWSNVYYG